MKKEYIKPEYIEVDINTQGLMQTSLPITDVEDVDESDKANRRDTNGLFDW